MTFQTMRLVEPVARAIEDEGYDTPTPIQAQTIPEAMTGRDVLGCAQTGTGKTCAFALPILHQLASSDQEYQMPRKAHRGRPPRALVLCPTRELAMQIHESFRSYGRHLDLRHAVVYGGVKQGRQVNALRNGVDILIATPGRLLDLVNQGHVDLSEIQYFVLDEADRMLDMGFIDDTRRIVSMIPNKHQTLFFSATVSNEIRELADSILKDPLKVETTPEATAVDKIDQCVYMVKREDKPQALFALLERDSVECALVFTKTKHGADRLVRHLRRSEYRSDAIHSNKTQNRRNDIMNAFRSGRISVLVATDIAARGIDVNGITHVVNYDLPMESETYVHRIGRTARAGASGIAITFCDKSERRLLKNVERRTRTPIKVATDLDISKRVEKKECSDTSDRKHAGNSGPIESTSESYDTQDWKKDKKKNSQKSGKKSWDGKKGNRKSGKWSEGPKSKRHGQVSSQDERSESGDRQPREKSTRNGGKPGWKSKHPYKKGKKRSRDGESGGSTDARDGDREGSRQWTPNPKAKPGSKYKSSGGKSNRSGDRNERSERTDRSDRPSRSARGGSKPRSEGTRGKASRTAKSGAPKHQWKKLRGEYRSDQDREESSQGSHDGAARKSGQGKWKARGFKSGAKPRGSKSGAKPRAAKPGRSRSGGFKSSKGKPGGFKSGGPKRNARSRRHMKSQGHGMNTR